ncbi:MAG: alpha/beta fold hydrolase [Dehalococcoidia bacterium]
MRFESKWVTVSDINTHYLVGGEGPPLVLIHGLGAMAGDVEWKDNLEPLAQNHRVYVPDLAGYGKSDKPRINYSFKFLNTFFEDLLAKLNLEQVSFIGHSLGGGIALDFTLKHPEKVNKLVLVDTAGLSDKLGFPGRLLFPIFTLIARIKGNHVFHSLMTGGNEGEPMEIYMDRLHEIRVPTLILWGGWDGYIPASLAHQAHARMKNSRLHIFSRCWHAPQKQRAGEFNRLVTDFLTQ